MDAAAIVGTPLLSNPRWRSIQRSETTLASAVRGWRLDSGRVATFMALGLCAGANQPGTIARNGLDMLNPYELSHSKPFYCPQVQLSTVVIRAEATHNPIQAIKKGRRH